MFTRESGGPVANRSPKKRLPQKIAHKRIHQKPICPHTHTHNTHTRSQGAKEELRQKKQQHKESSSANTRIHRYSFQRLEQRHRNSQAVSRRAPVSATSQHHNCQDEHGESSQQAVRDVSGAPPPPTRTACHTQPQSQPATKLGQHHLYLENC